MRQALGWLTVSWLLFAAPSRAQEPPPQPPQPPQAQQPQPAQDQSTEEKLQELDQKVRILERREEIRQEQDAEKAKAATSVTAGKDGFSIKSADGAFVLKLRGYAQLDGRFFHHDEQRPAIDTFTLRRVRPILEGTVYKIFDFRFMPDFGGGQTVLYEAYGEARFSPLLRVRAGKLKPPIGLERLQSAADLLFAERALPTNLVPNRDLGVQLAGDVDSGVVSYAVGVFNGVVDLGNQADGDNNDSKDVAARLFVQPFLVSGGPLKSLGVGIAGSLGHQDGSVAVPALPSYRSPAQQTFFSYRSDGTAAGTAFADGRHLRIAPQAYFYRGPFGLLAEYTVSRQEVRRAAELADLDHRAWQAAVSWLIAGGGDASYRGVSPRHPFDPAGHAWGAFELVARWSKLELDGKTFPTFANPASSARSAVAWAVGVNWYLNKSLKLMLDYETTRFDGGSGSASGIADREDENILFSRFQIAF